MKCSPEEEGCVVAGLPVAAPPAEPLSVHREVLPNSQDGEGESLNRESTNSFKLPTPVLLVSDHREVLPHSQDGEGESLNRESTNFFKLPTPVLLVSDHREVLPHCQDGEGESLNREHKLRYKWIISSVADPGCLSLILDPDFYPSRIPDPKIATNERSEKKFVFCSHKVHKIQYYLMFEMQKKKIWANFKEILKFLPKKLSKIWGWDPESEKNLFRIPGSKRHRIPDPDPQH